MSIDEQDGIAEIEISTSEELSEPENKELPPDTLRILEALLFASEEIMPASRLKTILPDNPDARQIRKMVDKINEILQKERHPFEIVEIGGGYQFRTVSYYHPWVRQIFKEKAAKKLSIQSLECLAIIAYKQPLSKAEIEAIRGVVSDGAMKTLLEKRLVTITGRSDKPGRPLLYGTTHEFLKYFGLNKIEDLPRLEEFEAIAREKINELSLNELQNESETSATDDNVVQQKDSSGGNKEITEPVSIKEESENGEDKTPESVTKLPDGFEIHDDISDEELTETTLQIRESGSDTSIIESKADIESERVKDDDLLDQKTEIIVKQDEKEQLKNDDETGNSDNDEGDFEVTIPDGNK